MSGAPLPAQRPLKAWDRSHDLLQTPHSGRGHTLPASPFHSPVAPITALGTLKEQHLEQKLFPQLLQLRWGETEMGHSQLHWEPPSKLQGQGTASSNPGWRGEGERALVTERQPDNSRTRCPCMHVCPNTTGEHCSHRLREVSRLQFPML